MGNAAILVAAVRMQFATWFITELRANVCQDIPETRPKDVEVVINFCKIVKKHSSDTSTKSHIFASQLLKIHASRTLVVCMLSANWTTEIQFASVRKEWPEIHSSNAVRFLFVPRTFPQTPYYNPSLIFLQYQKAKTVLQIPVVHTPVVRSYRVLLYASVCQNSKEIHQSHLVTCPKPLAILPHAVPTLNAR